MNPNVKRNVDFVKAHLRSNLTDLLGSNVNTSLESVKEKVTDTLDHLQLQDIISHEKPYKIGKIFSLWDSWDWKSKLKWYWDNKITNKAKKEREKVDHINDVLLNYYRSEFETNPNVESPEICKYPEWAEGYPKSVVITDIVIQPTQSLESISFSIEVKK